MVDDGRLGTPTLLSSPRRLEQTYIFHLGGRSRLIGPDRFCSSHTLTEKKCHPHMQATSMVNMGFGRSGERIQRELSAVPGGYNKLTWIRIPTSP